tara:strand:- start:910 stop:1599 length:690 start_codon:yes stop_codon:yes gene_type:complete
MKQFKSLPNPWSIDRKNTTSSEIKHYISTQPHKNIPTGFYNKTILPDGLNEKYRASGVLVLRIDENKEIEVLLGLQDRQKGKKYNDFGGKRELKLDRTPLHTARRELKEETNASFDNLNILNQCLWHEDCQYVLYFGVVDDENTFFDDIKNVEIIEYRWFLLKEVLCTISNTSYRDSMLSYRMYRMLQCIPFQKYKSRLLYFLDEDNQHQDEKMEKKFKCSYSNHKINN